MKKILILFLTVFMLCTLNVLPVLAAPTGSLTARTMVDKSGTRFTIELSIQDNPGFIAISCLAEYDNKVLKLVSAENGQIFDNIFMPSQSLSVIPYKLMFMEATSTSNITKNGILAKYTFEVLDTATVGKTEIKFKIDETVTVDNSSVSFKDCSVKINIGGTSSETEKPENSSNTAVTDKDAASQVSHNQTVEILKPQNDSIDLNQSVYDESTKDSNNDTNTSFDTIIVIIVILGVLVLGTALTAFAVELKKKKSK